MEYENKEAKKLFRWFLLCSVIILVLSATVAMFAVRSYRVKENEAVTAMLGIVLKNDGSDTEESRQEKISECMRMLEHPHAYQKSHQKEIKEAEKILQSYGISEAEPVIAGTKTMERRILLRTLGGVLLAELAAGGLFFIYQKRRSRKLAELSDYMEEIVRGHYDLALADNTEDELSHLKNQLYKITLFLKEESDHAKEKKTALAESVADISHQLKTPLTSASILLDNLNENEQMPPETRRRFLREISRQIYSMNWMIVAMLKLSRLDAGMVALKKEPFPVNRMLTEAIDHLEIFAELKGVKIRVCGMEAQVLRVGDLDWNREAVQNILKNAIEHSKKGETVTVTLSDNAVYTSVSIANPGAPITKEKIKKIFERYYSAANDGSSNIGIGLPLAKAILEKQNAYLSVESENGYNVFLIKYLK